MSSDQGGSTVDQTQEQIDPSSITDIYPTGVTDEGSPTEMIPLVCEDHPSSLPLLAPLTMGVDGTGIIGSEEVLRRAQDAIKNTPPELWGSYLRASTVILLVGEASAGKTVLLYNLAYHLASGQEFLGFTPPRHLRVLSVDFEGNDEIRAMNLTAVGTADGWGFYIPPENLFDLQPVERGPELIGRLESAIRVHGYDLVIVDSLIEAYPVEDENNNDHANSQMVAFRRLAKSTGAGVILVHNTGLKQNEGNKANKKGLARGASSRVDRADLVLNYTVEPKGERQLTVVKSRSNNLGEHIRVRFSGELGYEVIASAAAAHSAIEKLQAESLRVVQQEASQGRVNVQRKTIMDELGITEGSPQSQSLDHALRKSLAVGVLVKPAKGVYTLPPAETHEAANGPVIDP
jgi:KaiC/GvpD/RAD55 family RecA-like ATPase